MYWTSKDCAVSVIKPIPPTSGNANISCATCAASCSRTALNITAYASTSSSDRTCAADRSRTALSITTYAVRFNNWTGESFETLGTRQGPRDTVLVDTRLNRPNDPAVPIT